jgi:phosphoribosyl 1,2-cyclic phosphate phosphodiesterase
MRLTILGTGTSFGVPMVGCDCGVCHSADPRDSRSRTAALIDTGTGTILIDTPPELRVQLLAARVSRVDAVLYTHEHADHVAGIDDLRIFSVRRPDPLPVYAAREVGAYLRAGYGYIFDSGQIPYPGTSKPELDLRRLEPGRPVSIAGMEVLPLEFSHGFGTVLGFRMGPLAYVTDVKEVPAEARAALRGVEVLVLNALWWRPHPTHLSIPEAIETARDIGAKRTLLTHLTHETGHADLAARLPPGVEPATDGLVVEIPT